ncbi:hypothetical protein OIB37_32675 [Streptomyces sp. NBC_00820]|uniref:hypothetical protein n=1 Tax=Streptomyces sp. NBC_00820 TaxID=2975842 RepID=UPI002ED34D35|nr:hypothetical protein OIB37_32675 [Streptomyces sp. NBC_00820]
MVTTAADVDDATQSLDSADATQTIDPVDGIPPDIGSGKWFERGGAPLLLSRWTVKSSYGGEPREHSYPWVLPRSVTVRRLTFGVARSA